MPTAEPFNQAFRPIELQTPLGDDVLGLRSMLVREELGRLFTIEVELSSNDPDLKFEDIVGHPVVVRLDLPDSTERRFWHCFVARFSFVGQTDRYTHYRATLVPWLWALTRSADCRIFQQKKLPDIVQEVFKDRGSADVESRLSGSYPVWEYCTQYRETDFNFVSRLLEQEGIAYYFKHDKDKGQLVLADAKSSYDPVPGASADLPYRPAGSERRLGDAIRSWIVEQEIQPTHYVLTDYNPLTPATDLKRASQKDRPHGINDRQVFDFPGEYLVAAEGERLAKTRLEELQASHEIVRGETTCLSLGAGHLFKLTEHPRADQNREYLTTSVTLFYDVGEFSSQDKPEPRVQVQFTAIPSEAPFRPARSTPKPLIQGPQPAIVVGPSGEEIHTDEHGRIKVHFFWNRESAGDEKSSCFVRVAQAWAGKSWGTVFLPRIGHEVLVEFLEGDPDRPVVTGSVYNGANKPPYALPAEKTKTTIKSLSSPDGGGFNELRFEDKKGSEEIFIHAEKNFDIRVKSNQVTAIGNERHETVEKKVITHFKDEHHLKVTKDEFTQHEADTHAIINGSRHEQVDGDDNLGIGGDRKTGIDGAENLEIGGDRMTKISGADHLKITKDLAIETTGKTSIKASDIFGKAGAIAFDGDEIHLKGAKKVIIESGTQISLKVGGSLIDISASGVAIVGPQVKVNSGGSAGSGGGCVPLSPAAPASPDEPDPKEPAQPPSGEAGQKTTFSAAAAALKYAALTGLPFCEECPRQQPPPPAPDEPDDPDVPPPAPVTHTAEIEINDTPDTKDDLVRLKGGNPVVRHRVPCRIRLTSDSPDDVPVVLTNPDGRLRFPGEDAKTLSLSLPSSGDFVSFEISGETASAALGDAKIEAHQDSETGAKIGTKDVTVFSFDPAKLTITNPGTYSLVGRRLVTTDAVATALSAEAKIKPAGVDCSAPQLAQLRIGIMQNDVTSAEGSIVSWDSPTVDWDPDVPAGTTVSVPKFIMRIRSLPVPANDVAPTVAPLYDQPGKDDTLDNNSLKPPVGCPDGGPATSSDTPATSGTPAFVLEVTDASGKRVGDAIYTLKMIRINGVFKTWTVVFDPTDNSFETLRERGWKLNVSSAATTPQKATTDAADAAPSTTPVLAPTANTIANDPANETIEHGPAVTFTR